jgi:hypothetical protein
MIRVVHSGSRIRMLTFSHPGSRIPDPGVKKAPNPGSRIPDPDPQHWLWRSTVQRGGWCSLWKFSLTNTLIFTLPSVYTRHHQADIYSADLYIDKKLCSPTPLDFTPGTIGQTYILEIYVLTRRYSHLTPLLSTPGTIRQTYILQINYWK